MTEQDQQQRSLAGYKSKVHEAGDFENPNEGKPVLDDSEEYVLRLTKFPNVKTFDQIKEKKDGTRATIKVDKAICEFEERDTKNIVTAFFRVDSLNFSDDESFESGVVRFFKKIKNPLPENIAPDWTQYFIVGMRFRGRVVIGKGQDKKPNGNYYLDVPTCRPLLPSDKAREDFGTTASDAPKTDANAVSLAKAKILVVGCENFDAAYGRLLDAKVIPEVIQAFMAADKRGEIQYPIK